MRKTSLNMVHELARTDDRVVFIGSDLGVGTMSEFQAEFEDRFSMEGVAEANLIGMAAGMAMEGYTPFVNTIATFLTRRCFEQVAVDLCMHNLPVRLIANGGGLVYAPLGPTHLAIEDIAILRTLPNMTIVCPSDAEEMKHVIPAVQQIPGPVYIRLGKGGDPVLFQEDKGFSIGHATEYRAAGDITIVSTGVATYQALLAVEALEKQGIKTGLYHFHTVKPLDTEAVAHIATRSKLVLSVEEHVITGGLGSSILEAMTKLGTATIPRVHLMGIPDSFPDRYGSQADLMHYLGLDASSIVDTVMKLEPTT